jgi:ABC-type glycerol-3-phosphate transport system substrate-binding protein
VTPRGDTPAARRTAARLATGLALLAAVSLTAACGGGTTAQGSNETRTTRASAPATTTSSAVPEALFAERQPGGEDMMAEIRGELILDDEGCLRVRF